MLVYMPVQVMLANMPEAGMAMAMPAMGATHMMLAVTLRMGIFLMFIRCSLRGFSNGLFLGSRAGCWRSGIQFLGSLRLYSCIGFLCRIRLLPCIWLALRGGFGGFAGLGLSVGLDWSASLFFGGKSVAGDIVERY